MVTAEHGKRLAGSVGRGAQLLVVADRIAADAKRSLRTAGVNYFDRRGHLRIVAPPLVIDTVVESALLIAGGSGGSLDSQVAKEVAVCCLLTPDQPHGVREVARYIDRASSAVSKAMAGLRDDGLLTSAGEAMIPDLFHALLAVWRRRTIPLTAVPGTSTWEAQRLGLGLDKGRARWAGRSPTPALPCRGACRSSHAAITRGASRPAGAPRTPRCPVRRRPSVASMKVDMMVSASIVSVPCSDSITTDTSGRTGRQCAGCDRPPRLRADSITATT